MNVAKASKPSRRFYRSNEFGMVRAWWVLRYPSFTAASVDGSSDRWRYSKSTDLRHLGIVELFADVPGSAEAQWFMIRSNIVGGAILPCVRYRWLTGCASLQIGRMWIRGLDAPIAVSAATSYLGAGVRAEANLDLSAKWFLLANMELHRTLTPVTLEYRATRIWNSPDVSYALGIGIAGRIP